MHEITTTIEFQMSLLLFVSLAGYLLASRIGQPAVVGIILVGLVIGPSALGLITYTDFIRSIAHLGAVVLLFVIGLEFEFKDLASFKYGLIGLFGVLVPLAGGYWLSSLFAYDFNSALFIGVALTATSIAITADTLREMGRLESRAARAIIGAAVVDDVLALLVLSMAQQMIHGELLWTTALLSLAKAGAFLAAGTGLGILFIEPALKRLDRSTIGKQYPEIVFIFAMMLAFFYGMMAELVGLSAIVGSFIAGICLEEEGLINSKDFKEGAEYLRIIFASIFFVSIGVLVDFSRLSIGVLWFLLALTAMAFATKLLGCGLPSWLLGLGPRNSLAVGLGMSPRAEVAMIVALLGLNQGILPQGVYVALVLMGLLTTIIPPLLIRNWVYGKSGQEPGPG
jgi:Kef-type K+ transport system membrane component KefB